MFRSLAISCCSAALICGGSESAWAQIKTAETKAALQQLESAVRGGNTTSAEALAEKLPESGPLGAFWKAQALLLVERRDESLALFAEACEAGGDLADHARLSWAAALAKSGEPGSAAEVLAPVANGVGPLADQAKARSAELWLEAEQLATADTVLQSLAASTQRSLLTARLALTKEELDKAEAALSTVPQQDDPFHATWLILKARLLAAQGKAAASAQLLDEWIPLNPNHPQLGAAFEALEITGALSQEAVVRLLSVWKQSPVKSLKEQATFYAGVAAEKAGQLDVAIADYFQAIAEATSPQLSRDVRFRLAKAALKAKPAQPATAKTALEGLDTRSLNRKQRTEALWLRGQAKWSESDYAGAQQDYETASKLAPTPALAQFARFNASLCELQANPPKPGSRFQEIKSQPALNARYLLERGKWEAAQGQGVAATRTLEAFLATQPAIKEARQALYTLVEIDLFQKLPPATDAARQRLNAAMAMGPAPGFDWQWLAIWLEAADGKLEQALTAGDKFLAAYPLHSLTPAVRSKRAELMKRLNRYSAAASEYEKLAEEAPDAASGARGLYLAALAAAEVPAPDSAESPRGLHRALELWSSAAKTDESLLPAVRWHQASSLARLGKTATARRLIDELIEAKPAPSKDSLAALHLARGRLGLQPRLPSAQPSLPATPEVTAVDDFRTAVELAADDSELRSTAWLELAHWHLAKDEWAPAAEGLKQASQPLLHASPSSAAATAPPAAVQAAFEWLSALQRRKEWTAAVTLADQLGRLDHPRAEEARREAERLKLRHFMWEM